MREMSKDDYVFVAESKGASVGMVNGPNWSYWWLDMPTKNMCLVAEFVPDDYPCFRVFVTTNDKAREMIVDQKAHGWMQIGE